MPTKKATKKAAPRKPRTTAAPQLTVKKVTDHDIDIEGPHDPILLGDVDWRDKGGSKRTNPDSNATPWIVVRCRRPDCTYRVIVESYSLAEYIASKVLSTPA